MKNILILAVLIFISSCGGSSDGGGGGATPAGDVAFASSSSIKYNYFSKDLSGPRNHQAAITKNGMVYMEGPYSTDSQYDDTAWRLKKIGLNGSEVFDKEFPTDVATEQEYTSARLESFGGDGQGNSVAIVRYLKMTERNQCCEINEYWFITFDSEGIERGRVRFDDPLNFNDSYIFIYGIIGNDNKFYIQSSQGIFIIDIDANFINYIEYNDEDSVGRGMYTAYMYGGNRETIYIDKDDFIVTGVKTHNHYGDYGAYIRRYREDGTFENDKLVYYSCPAGCNRGSWVPYHSGDYRSMSFFGDKAGNYYHAFRNQDPSFDTISIQRYEAGDQNSGRVEHFPTDNRFGIHSIKELEDGDFLIVGTQGGSLALMRYSANFTTRKWVKVFDEGGSFSARLSLLSPEGNLVIFGDAHNLDSALLGTSSSNQRGVVTISKGWLSSFSDTGNVNAAKVDTSVIATPPLLDFGEGPNSALYSFSCGGQDYRQTINYTATACLEAKKFYTETMTCVDTANFITAFDLCESACGSVICEE